VAQAADEPRAVGGGEQPVGLGELPGLRGDVGGVGHGAIIAPTTGPIASAAPIPEANKVIASFFRRR